MYKRYIKRILDIICALLTIILFSWLYIILIILGAVFMGGNPFFTQRRPGMNEKIFKMIKFRTMDNSKDRFGNLLPDEKRLNKYGKFLRKTSLDEIPEAFNILIGDMSVVGPRPLLVDYLPRYNEFQKHRHDVKPGLSGLAQVNGRNAMTWEERFEYDVEYTRIISFKTDLKIVFLTFWKAIIKSEGVSPEGQATMEEFFGDQVKINKE